MSLKQRAMQCSAYIPATQYVPVYSRPHRANHARWHEELAPIAPKPAFDESGSTRTQSIHEAVKLWLESSPNSVIGPHYRSRSPSSGSPLSHGSPIEQPVEIVSGSSASSPRLERADSALRSPVRSRAGDVGTDALYPAHDSIEQGDVIVPETASSPPLDRANSTPSEESDDRSHVGTAALPPMQESGEQSTECVLSNNSDTQCRANDFIAASDLPKANPSQVSIKEEEPAAGTNEYDTGKRGGRKRPINDLKVEQNRSCVSLSQEFDTALIVAAKRSGKVNPIEPLSTVSGKSGVGGPKILLKPPRGLEKHVSHIGEHKAADKKLPFHQTAGTTEELTRCDGGSMAGLVGNSSTGVSEIVGANVTESKELFSASAEHKSPSVMATPNGIDESRHQLGPRKSWEAQSLSVKPGLRMEQLSSAEKPQSRSSDSPAVVLKGESSVKSANDFRTVARRRRMLQSYSSGGSTASTHHAAPQNIYEVSPPHQSGRRSFRSMKHSVASTESSQRFKNSSSNERQASPTKAALEKAKRDKLQAKSEAWENAKNATFLNKYKREENKIYAWEEHKILKASEALNKLEVELEKKRAKAAEKMQLEIAMAHKKAEEMKANAEAKRAEKAAKAAVQAQVMRVLGKKSPLSCFCS